MGPVENENFLTAADYAIREKVDIWIVIFQSAGIDVHSGITGLAGMPKTIIAMNEIKEARIPTFAVASRAVTGGTYASAFFQHEFIIIESKSVDNLLFSGRRVTSNILKVFLSTSLLIWLMYLPSVNIKFCFNVIITKANEPEKPVNHLTLSSSSEINSFINLSVLGSK